MAIRVVDKALQDGKLDPIKKAGIAQTALKGLGYYSSDQAAIAVKLEQHFTSAGARQMMELEAAKQAAKTATACAQDAQTGETEES